MGAPGARNRDMGNCRIHGPSILSATEYGLFVNGHASVRAGDLVRCRGAEDFVVTGSQTVLLHGVPMARVGDRTLHGGQVTTGSGNVNIGGPDSGSSLGVPGRGNRACLALAAGRTSGGLQQTYGNCGLESIRLLMLKKYGRAPTEDEFLEQAIKDKKARPSPNPDHRGGTTPSDEQSILDQQGMKSQLVEQTPATIAQAVAERRGVIISVDGGILWEDPTQFGGAHAVNVIGVRYDEQGRIAAFKISDTGALQGEHPDMCCEEIPVDKFAKSLLPRGKMVVTDDHIWATPLPPSL
jgi:uncharacterized Zn-binding protein involved in type VI secretion